MEIQSDGRAGDYGAAGGFHISIHRRTVVASAPVFGAVLVGWGNFPVLTGAQTGIHRRGASGISLLPVHTLRSLCQPFVPARPVDGNAGLGVLVVGRPLVGFPSSSGRGARGEGDMAACYPCRAGRRTGDLCQTDSRLLRHRRGAGSGAWPFPLARLAAESAGLGHGCAGRCAGTLLGANKRTGVQLPGRGCELALRARPAGQSLVLPRMAEQDDGGGWRAGSGARPAGVVLPSGSPGARNPGWDVGGLSATR